MGELVAGGAVGLAFSVLWEIVKTVSKTTIKFSYELDLLKQTLKVLGPIIGKINIQNLERDQDNGEIQDLLDWLKNGQDLVRKCSTIKVWRLDKRYTHSRKLRALDEKLLRFCQIDLQCYSYTNNNEMLSILRRGSSVSLASGESCEIPGLPDFVVGLEDSLVGLKRMILEDDVSAVVLSASGGFGKTTLAKKLCHDMDIKSKFQKIIFITVSQNAYFEDIVRTIFDNMRQPVPDFRGEEHAKTQLEPLLKKEGCQPMLLVLDDVWPASKKIAQNVKFCIPGYKILITSRFDFPELGSTFKVKRLEDEDAKRLFRHIAFPNKDVPNALLDEVVKGCKGSPLAVTVVAGSLQGQHETKLIDVVNKWSNGESMFDSHEELLNCLLPSFDALDQLPFLKDCYLDLASFPEDQRIPACVLLDMWVEMYNLDENGMATLIQLLELSKRNLVNLFIERKCDNGIDDYCNGHFVMLHDVLRDLANHLCNQGAMQLRKRLIIDVRKDNLLEGCCEEDKKLIHAHLLSIFTDEKSTVIMKPYKVKTLLLNLWTRSYRLPQFMEALDELKVLVITNYGFSTAEVNNMSVLGYLPNLTRIRFECVSVSPFSIRSLQLRNLRKISFNMCKIGMAFDNCTDEVTGIWPNIVEINIEYCDDLVKFPTAICNMSRLKKLRITYCQNLIAFPDKFGNLTNLEVLSLHSCTKLSCLPESIGSLQNLRFLDISACASLSKLPEQIGDLCFLGMLNMIGCEGLQELPQTVRKLEQLEDVLCNEDKCCLWEYYFNNSGKPRIVEVKEEKNLNWLPHSSSWQAWQ